MAVHEGMALTRDPCLCLGIGDGLHGMTSHLWLLRLKFCESATAASSLLSGEAALPALTPS